MNIWAKIVTAIKGGVTETGEAIVDSQALRILDQEVREASEELKLSKASLAESFAKFKVSEGRIAEVKKEIKEHEDYAIKALDKGDESLALEIAQKVSQLSATLIDETSHSKELSSHVEQLKTTIAQTDRNIARLKQQVDTVKATDSLQKAQSAVAERYAGSESKLRTAMDSLERIKEKQKHASAKMEAASELAAEISESSLQEKLFEAGIVQKGESPEDILARLTKKKSGKTK